MDQVGGWRDRGRPFRVRADREQDRPPAEDVPGDASGQAHALLGWALRHRRAGLRWPFRAAADGWARWRSGAGAASEGPGDPSERPGQSVDSMSGDAPDAVAVGMALVVRKTMSRSGEDDRREHRVERDQHAAGLVGAGSAADAQIVLRATQAQLAEERPRHGVVVMLSGVDELGIEPGPQGRLERGSLDELGSRPDDADDPQRRPVSRRRPANAGRRAPPRRDRRRRRRAARRAGGARARSCRRR